MKFYENNEKSIICLNDEESAPTGFFEISEQEYNRINDIYSQIALLKFELKKTDYRAIKYAEGCYTEEEYQPYKEARQSFRNQINELEATL